MGESKKMGSKQGFLIQHYERLRFSLYILLVLLINITFSYYLIRFDLTEKQSYSLAEVSKNTIAQLEEPVTIRAYFSTNLPSGYNMLPNAVRDLMQAYAAAESKGLFNYQVNMIDSGSKSEKNEKLRDEARSYGISEVTIAGMGSNQYQEVSVYMGLVITQGDRQETFLLNPNDNIQYLVTSKLKEMSRVSSALFSQKEPVRIYYYMSSDLQEIGSGSYRDYPENFISVIDKVKKKLYGKVRGEVVDPAALGPGMPDPGELDLSRIEAVPGSQGLADAWLRKKSEAVEGGNNLYHALVMEYGGEYTPFELLLSRPSIDLRVKRLLPRIELPDPAELEEFILGRVVSILGIVDDIGVVADRDTARMDGMSQRPAGPSDKVDLSSLRMKAGDLYQFKPVYLDQGIPRDISVLLLVDPEKKLTNWDLYLLDQFVMRGGRLIVAVKPYQVVLDRSNPYARPSYVSNPNILSSGSGEEEENSEAEEYTLRDLLAWYGIEYEPGMVFDKQSYIHRMDQGRGYEEREVYYYPEILTSNYDIDKFPFIKNLEMFFVVNSASLKWAETAGVEPLVQTSPEAWVETLEGGKTPDTVYPPGADTFSRQTLIALREGQLTSFFADKERPEKPVSSEEEEEEKEETSDEPNLAEIEENFIAESENGHVLVSGSSEIFSPVLIGERGQPGATPGNEALPLNLLDYMAGNEGMAVLRSSGILNNPIRPDVDNSVKNLIKWFNLAGLPLIVGAAGLFVLLYWRSRQTRLKVLFSDLKSNVSRD